MCSFRQTWGTWKFTDASQDDLKSLTALFKCQSSRLGECKYLNNKSWCFVMNKLKAENFQKRGVVKLADDKGLAGKETETDGSKLETPEDNEGEIELEGGTLDKSALSDLEDPLVEEDDEVPKIIGDICDCLKKEPLSGISAKVDGNDAAKVLLAVRNGLCDEESVANLLLSFCPPVEENMLVQSRWAPALYQHIILPEILERTSPVPRVLSSAISQLATSSPDACVQLLCIPLLLSPKLLNGPADLMQPAIEVLTKVMEESLPPLQKSSLFRAFYKEVLHQSRVTVQEELFPLLQAIAESEGAFGSADPELLSNLINWIELCSQEYASSIKFTKYLVALLKGMTQDFNSRKDSGTNYLSSEEKMKLRNIVSENKTFLRKIAEKSLNSLE
ncbi:uncharacterized protein LOC124158732 [Ischnura elegans]|uniref:uncharacterized protein LOC124158732 n=1 Tax=Ischnura elegans TaxID=197161 RepID=UPI001ED89AD9|nr:uncharacterized protein LOC124158732 [Ischnura elegans]